MNLFGATSVGVGAIVGGGILALAGIAFSTTGPAAIAAFALNGVFAALTAVSFAEMAAAFPESGGTYTFSKKVLSAPAAFIVGWVVWFASVVAAVLYALGFAFYAATAVETVFPAISIINPGRVGILSLAVSATVFYSMALAWNKGEGGQWATWGKVVIFAIIIAAGFIQLAHQPFSSISAHLTPFFKNRTIGLFKAMGYTFIALQGFDLIAAVAGEVKEPEKNIPRAIFLSLGIALAIYIPLLFVISTAGVADGRNITDLSRSHPETVMAFAVKNFMGPAGYWLIMVGAAMAMLSALRANLFAASRIAMAMARDRTLPRRFGHISRSRHTPIHAIVLTLVMVLAVLFIINDVSEAGAAASLIFLISFALANWTAILVRVRTGARFMPFRAPWFPVIPVIGGTACIALAIFQGLQVPSAGIIVLAWLAAGGALYLIFFARRARVVDASSAAMDPRLLTLRGRSPLVLVPIVNPSSASFMVSVATTMAPPAIGRVLLLSVVRPPENWNPGDPPARLINAQTVLKEALTASFSSGLAPQALITVAPKPWDEIARTARTYNCESLLLGLSDLDEKNALKGIEGLMNRVDSDVVVLRTANDWNFSSIKSVLVPVGGRGGQDRLRARLLGSLQYSGIERITFLKILPENAEDEQVKRSKKILRRQAEDEQAEHAEIIVIKNNNPTGEIIRRASGFDLLILGLQRLGPRRKMFGDAVLKIAKSTSCGLILINRKG
ncbi:MAG: amino acid permease [Deltaproteobacteria bacterium]|nr:amino acid permease [Deltaproteobacteria bacterium]